MYNVLIHILTVQLRVLSLDMYECFMTTKYLCACLKRYHGNLIIKQG